MLRTVFGMFLLAMAAGCAVTPAEQRYAEASTTKHCVDTGTRIASREGDCTLPGHSYSISDIHRTGAPTAAGALRLLHPSIMISQ